MSEATQVRPTVRVEGGALVGKIDHGVPAFLGIPYAAPPFGPNRMQPPRPAEPWDGERDATEYGPTAPKGDYPPQFAPLFPEIRIPGEDVLNLNVWTPDPQATGLPVLVWIHGGSFMNGSGSVAAYRGSSFARDGIVCVTINYRLGADGFLYLGDGVANVGLLDQIAALEWVQRNIAAFGGDPDRVTVAGESAGAMSITTLLAMPGARGLFRQAVIESGAAAHTLTPEVALTVSRFLAEALNVPATREAITALPVDQVVQAASALVEEVQTAPDPAKWGSLALSLLPFAPVVDGETLPQHPLDALAGGASSDVALLVGSNNDEARLFVVPNGAIDFIDEAVLAAAATGYGAPDEALATYRAARPDAGHGDVMAAVVSDWFFRIPAIRVAEAHAGPTWMYRFDYWSPSFDGKLGACHGTEVPFVFDTLDDVTAHPLIGTAPPQAVADTAHAAWVRFVADGDPGWPRYDADTRTTALLDEELTVVDDPDGAEREVWTGRR